MFSLYYLSPPVSFQPAPNTCQLYDNKTSIATSGIYVRALKSCAYPSSCQQGKGRRYVRWRFRGCQCISNSYWLLLFHSVQGRRIMPSSSQLSHNFFQPRFLTINPLSHARKHLVSARHLSSLLRMTVVRLPAVITLNYLYLKKMRDIGILWFQSLTCINVAFTL